MKGLKNSQEKFQLLSNLIELVVIAKLITKVFQKQKETLGQQDIILVTVGTLDEREKSLSPNQREEKALKNELGSSKKTIIMKGIFQ